MGSARPWTGIGRPRLVAGLLFGAYVLGSWWSAAATWQYGPGASGMRNDVFAFQIVVAPFLAGLLVARWRRAAGPRAMLPSVWAGVLVVEASLAFVTVWWGLAHGEWGLDLDFPLVFGLGGAVFGAVGGGVVAGARLLLGTQAPASGEAARPVETPAAAPTPRDRLARVTDLVLTLIFAGLGGAALWAVADIVLKTAGGASGLVVNAGAFLVVVVGGAVLTLAAWQFLTAWPTGRAAFLRHALPPGLVLLAGFVLVALAAPPWAPSNGEGRAMLLFLGLPALALVGGLGVATLTGRLNGIGAVLAILGGGLYLGFLFAGILKPAFSLALPLLLLALAYLPAAGGAGGAGLAGRWLLAGRLLLPAALVAGFVLAGQLLPARAAGNLARAWHGATLLADGRVLVAGGRDVTKVSGPGSALLYDHWGGDWSATGETVTPAWFQTAIRLPDGRVLALGGAVPGRVSPAELYDPATGRWRATTPASGMRDGEYAGQSAVAMTSLPTGEVLLVGGHPSIYPDPPAAAPAALYDPATETWRPASDGGWALGFVFGLAPLSDGRVLALGTGLTPAAPDQQEQAAIYDPAARTWTPTAAPAAPRAGAVLAPLPDGRVLAAGGGGGLASAEVYDPAAGVWLPTGDMMTGRAVPAVAVLPDGRVLVAGGHTASFRVSGVLASAEVYDPRTGAWSATGDLGTPRVGHSLTVLPDGRVLAAGGSRSGYAAMLASAELYDPASGRWSPTGSMAAPFAADPLPSARALLTLWLWASLVYGLLLGGWSGGLLSSLPDWPRRRVAGPAGGGHASQTDVVGAR